MRNKERTLQTFRHDFRNAEIYLSRKVLAGLRRKLSLRDIATALSLPVRDIEIEVDILRQDAR